MTEFDGLERVQAYSRAPSSLHAIEVPASNFSNGGGHTLERHRTRPLDGRQPRIVQSPTCISGGAAALRGHSTLEVTQCLRKAA